MRDATGGRACRERYWTRWSAERHLRLMDEAGIGFSLLSLSSPGVHFGDDATARALARRMNDVAAATAARRPDRFGYFAVLPLPDTDGALAELDRAFHQLGARGVILLTNNAGHYLGDPRLHPVLAELDRLGAVVLLHPTSCTGCENLALGRPRPMIEFLFDTARTVVDFILSGAAERCPRLRIIVPHAGGVLPLPVDRVELFRSIHGESADRRTVAELLGTFHYDLAGTPSAPQLAALRSVAGQDRLLYGSDYAWTRHEQVLRAIGMLDRSLRPDAGGSWRRLTNRNARRLLASGPPNEPHHPAGSGS
ncbi:amidohydrolase family protein [Saccharothrix sp. ST-888]|uniref:amidohydrolase family protein n=1 Tax=Saccharothrix sp. ST-888 TaxID=1427391 RepID=UPI0005ED0744|nr:amidohydrolase family protein [Saccharothrix sp. ST-888]